MSFKIRLDSFMIILEMYKIKNTIYADAGFVLKHDNKLAFNFRDIDINSVSEIEVNFNDMFEKNGKLVYSNGMFKEIKSCANYGDWKSKIVGKQFTINDQIAIMLNKEDSEEDRLLYDKMQEWREWSGKFAKKIMEVCQQ